MKSKGLEFNAKKTKLISYHRGRIKLNHNYLINGTPIVKTDCVYLGIYLDEKLTFNQHISCERLIYGFVLRTVCLFKQAKSYIAIYQAFVRSKLEYASAIWSTFRANAISKIEKIQNRFLRAIEFRLTTVYPKRVPFEILRNNFWINSLEKYRNINLLLFLQNIFSGLLVYFKPY